MTKRILALLFAALLLVSSMLLVACSDKDTGGRGDRTEGGETTMDPAEASKLKEMEDFLATYTPEDTAESYTYDIKEGDYDYGGHEFKFLNANPIYYMYLYLDPDMTGDILDDTCYERNYEAETLFNITITEETQHNDGLAAYAKTLIYADEDVYDAMYIPANHVTPLVSENLFYDLLEVEELHIDRVWWDQPLISRNTIEDRLFFATSDLHLMAFEGIWLMYFNEDMMKSLGLEEPYELALNQGWTWEEFTKYCAAAASLNGDASFVFDVNGNSTYGMVDFGNAIYTAYGLGLEMATRDDSGRYQFTAESNPHFLSGWENLINFYGKDDGLSVICKAQDLDPDGYFTTFMEDRALFLHAELKGATMLREWEGNFGILPQPKYDAEQEDYNSQVLAGCLSFCIPTTNTNLERTGRIVDYLTYRSYTSLLPRYYDIHVSLKALGRQESKDVLKIIRGTRGLDASNPFGWTSDLYTSLQTLAHEGNLALASTIETYRNQCIANIENTYKTYPALNHN